VNAARAFLLPTDRWAGGMPGYGYLIVDHPVKGKTIARDEHAARVIADIAERLCAGESVTGIARDLNERGELTSRDHLRVLQGKPTRSRDRNTYREVSRELWSAPAIMNMMKNPRLLGYKINKGKPAIGLDGAPVQIAAPVLTHAQFQRVQDALDARSAAPRRTRRTTPLLGVVKCGLCGTNASRIITTPNKKGREYVYYRCNQRTPGAGRCTLAAVTVDRVAGMVQRAFLSQLRDVRVQTREWVRGEDHTAELGHVRRLRDSLENEKRTSTDWDDEDDGRYQASMRYYRHRIKTLRELPQRAAGWHTRLTDRTYGQEWDAADEQGRRQLLLNAGITLRILGRHEFLLTIPAGTMRAGYPGWQPHLSIDDVTYIAGDSGSTVDVEFTEVQPASPAA
jgi:hypothetical protein